MSKISLVITLVFILNIPVSCVFDECGDFQALEAAIEELNAEVGSLRFSGFTRSVSTDFEIAAIQILISQMEYREISHHDPTFSFSNVAFACSPPEPKPTQTITSLTITSDSVVFAQEKEFVAGQSLSELFKVSDRYSSDLGYTIDKFIKNQQEDLWLFGYEGADIFFQLRNKPDSSIKHNLEFEFLFSDSTRIVVESGLFQVNN